MSRRRAKFVVKKERTGGDRRFGTSELKPWRKLVLPGIKLVQNTLELVVICHVQSGRSVRINVANRRSVSGDSRNTPRAESNARVDVLHHFPDYDAETNELIDVGVSFVPRRRQTCVAVSNINHEGVAIRD